MTWLLFGKIITSKRNGKKIRVLWAPADRSHILLFLFINQSPDWKYHSFLRVWLFSLLPIIFVVIILSVPFILLDHSLHYLHASLEACRLHCLLLLLFLLFFLFGVLLVCSAFLIFFGFSSEFLDVGVKYLPLSDLSLQNISQRQTCWSTFLSYFRICGLSLSSFVIELVPHWLLDCWILIVLPSMFFPDPGSYCSAWALNSLSLCFLTSAMSDWALY